MRKARTASASTAASAAWRAPSSGSTTRPTTSWDAAKRCRCRSASETWRAASCSVSPSPICLTARCSSASRCSATNINYNQARQLSIFSGQRSESAGGRLQNLQNYSQSSAGFTTSLSYPLRHSFKRLGITYSLDRSTLVALSTASKILFDFIAFRGISGPNAVNGIITSKIFPNFSFNTLDSGISPHKGHQMTLGMELAGLGGTVRSVRPIVQYKQFIPVQNRRNTIGFNVQGSFISGYGGVVAPPFQRFFMGGENDIRGFDIRSVSPVAFLPSSNVITLTNPGRNSGSQESCQSAAGNWTVPIPVDQIVFPGRRSERVRRTWNIASPSPGRWPSCPSSMRASTRSSGVLNCRSPQRNTIR